MGRRDAVASGGELGELGEVVGIDMSLGSNELVLLEDPREEIYIVRIIAENEVNAKVNERCSAMRIDLKLMEHRCSWKKHEEIVGLVRTSNLFLLERRIDQNLLTKHFISDGPFNWYTK